MKRYDTVIFDLDGTLLNTLDDLANSINHALKTVGFPERTIDEVRRFVGDGALELARRASPAGTSEEMVNQVLEQFRLHYSTHSTVHTAPYPGIFDLMDALKDAGIQQAVVSNKPDAQVRSLCAVHFGEYVTLAAGDREGVRRKPEPDAVWNTMEQIGAKAERTLYVGDSDVDVLTARNAKVDCAAVTWGFRSEEELRKAGAVYLFDTAQALRDWIVNA